MNSIKSGDTTHRQDLPIEISRQLVELRINRPSIVITRGRSEKSKKTVENILSAARKTFVENGHAALSLRQVADEAGIAVGNLSYYFQTKEALIEATLREALADFADEHLKHFSKKDATAFDILLEFVEFYIRHARSSARFFFQMWGYAGSDENANQLIRKLYRPIGRLVYHLIRQSNPRLDDRQIRRITLQIFSLEEGYKLFIGMGPDDDIALQTAEADIRDLTRKMVFGSNE